MNAKAKFLANEKRDELFAAAGWRSVVSGRPLSEGVPQLAHRIAKTRNRLEMFGDEVMNHPLNLVPVLDLRENDSCNIGGQKLQAEALISKIIKINTGREPMPDLREYYHELRGEFRDRCNP